MQQLVQLVQLTRVFCRIFSMPSFLMLEQFHRDRQALKMMHMASKSFCKKLKLNNFLRSEVNLLIQHIIVQDQDGQNNNIKKYVRKELIYYKIVLYYKCTLFIVLFILLLIYHCILNLRKYLT